MRFDPVYFGHFKCNLRRIADYPNLSNYLRDLYQVPGVAATVDIPHVKKHYYGSHETINPTRIVPRRTGNRQRGTARPETGSKRRLDYQ